MLFIGSIGVSISASTCHPYFLIHALRWSSLRGMWAAFWKLVARSRPPWHDVQPKFSCGCGEPELMYMSRFGCVLNGCGASAYALFSMPRWQVVQRSTLGMILNG